MKIPMKNPKTGEIKEVKLGWSWTLFLFSSLFGLPLFLRRLYIWGGIFLALWVVNLIAPRLMGPEEAMFFVSFLFFVFMGLQIFLGVKGNEMTAKNYLEHDWAFVEPDSEITKLAKMRWGISV